MIHLAEFLDKFFLSSSLTQKISFSFLTKLFNTVFYSLLSLKLRQCFFQLSFLKQVHEFRRNPQQRLHIQPYSCRFTLEEIASSHSSSFPSEIVCCYIGVLGRKVISRALTAAVLGVCLAISVEVFQNRLCASSSSWNSPNQILLFNESHW